MSTKRFKLTKASKILILILIIAVIGGGIFFAIKKGVIHTKSNKSGGSVSTAKNIDTKDKTINISLDEWIGWKSIIDANGGLKTKSGSIYDKLGINVNIKIVNDATQSSNSLIKGDLNAAGYTINRVAFLSDKFKKSELDVVMPYITNYSNGGDGIIASSKFKTVESLVDAKIAVPQFSEAHSLVVWFVNQSDLSKEDKQKIIDNLIMFETPDEAAKAFFAGQVDVAATWEPYLTQAKNTSDCHVLFSTASSTKLIMDGVLFRSDFAEANEDTISKFIDGALQASNLYDTEFTAIKEVMPMFAGMSDDDIKSTTTGAALTNWSDNKSTLETEAPQIYTDMCNVWKSIGENVNDDIVKSLFDTTYMETLADTYQGNEEKTASTVKVTDENKESIENSQALLTKSATVNFLPDMAKFVDNAEAAQSLDEFIKIAKSLDGTIIQIEGNISSDNADEAGVLLSQQRADTVKQYFVTNGIDANRIITVGNGGNKPIAPNDTDENKAKNRRTDFFFKTMEQ